MKRTLNLWALAILMFSLSACGYKWHGDSVLERQYSSISIPYADGDKDGSLTSALVKQLALSSLNLDYKSVGGDLLLKVKIIDKEEDVIGYNHERDSENNIKNSIVPSESRLKVTAEVVLEDSTTGRKVMGPHKLSATVDYDYVFTSNGDNLLTFSMGQLEFSGAAQDVAGQPLNQALAKRVIEYISHVW